MHAAPSWTWPFRRDVPARAARPTHPVLRRRVESPRVVGSGFVPFGVGDQRPGAVGHDDLGHAANEGQRLSTHAQPVGLGFAQRGAGKRIARCAPRGHEDVGPVAIEQAHGRTACEHATHDGVYGDRDIPTLTDG